MINPEKIHMGVGEKDGFMAIYFERYPCNLKKTHWDNKKKKNTLHLPIPILIIGLLLIIFAI